MSGIGIIHLLMIIFFIFIILINCLMINFGFLYQRHQNIGIETVINNILTRFAPSMMIGFVIIGLSSLVCLLYNIDLLQTWIIVLAIPLAICLLVSLFLPAIMVIVKHRFSGHFIIPYIFILL